MPATSLLRCYNVVGAAPGQSLRHPHKPILPLSIGLGSFDELALGHRSWRAVTPAPESVERTMAGAILHGLAPEPVVFIGRCSVTLGRNGDDGLGLFCSHPISSQYRPNEFAAFSQLSMVILAVVRNCDLVYLVTNLPRGIR
jgi:hypothetical protein